MSCTKEHIGDWLVTCEDTDGELILEVSHQLKTDFVFPDEISRCACNVAQIFMTKYKLVSIEKPISTPSGMIVRVKSILSTDMLLYNNSKHSTYQLQLHDRLIEHKRWLSENLSIIPSNPPYSEGYDQAIRDEVKFLESLLGLKPWKKRDNSCIEKIHGKWYVCTDYATMPVSIALINIDNEWVCDTKSVFGPFDTKNLAMDHLKDYDQCK